MSGENNKSLEEFEKHAKEIENLISVKNLDLAQSKLKKLGKTFKNYPPLIILWADFYWAGGDIKRAEKDYIRALNSDSTYKDAYYKLALLYDARKQFNKVEEVLWAGVHNSSDPLYFYNLLEGFHTNMGDVEKAVEIVKTLEKEYKAKGEYLYKQAEAAYALGLFVDAIDLFRRSADRGYRGTEHYSKLSDCFRRLGFYNEAAIFLKKAIASNPGNHNLYDNLYRLLFSDLVSGDQDLLKAISIVQADRTHAVKEKINLTYLTADGEYDYYRHQLNEYLKTDPDDPAMDYCAFCRLYKNIIVYKEDFRHHKIDAQKSFLASLDKLREIGYGLGVNVFEGWQAYIDRDFEKAEDRFNQIANNPGNIPQYILREAEDGLEKIYQSSGSVTAGPDSKFALPAQVHKDFGVNLITAVSNNKIARRIGLEATVKKIIENIAYGASKSVLLTGPPGVGKTEAIRQLAHEIVSGNWPGEFANAKILETSTSEILAGAKYIGVWEQNLEIVCRNYGWAKHGIIYLTDFINVIGAGKTEGGGNSFIDYLLPLMDQNRIVVIGEMDSLQAEQFLWEHPRLARVLTRIEIAEPSRDEIIEILKDEIKLPHISKYAEFDDASLNEIIHLTGSFMPYKALPGKAIEIINKTMQTFRNPDNKEKILISPEIVLKVFSDATGIPEFIIDRTRRLDPDKMKSHFADRILGQAEALDSVMNTITTFKARLTDINKPIRSYLFVGPTGVGKTETAKVLAEYLFSSRDKMIRLNMSEYNDSNSLAKLTGSYHGGIPKSGPLIDKIRKSPFSVVLLDEIEKANNEVLNILLQLLDEGVISDSEGKAAYFNSSIIIMTSNLGSRHYSKDTIGFGKEQNISNVTNAVMSDVKAFFSPEIYNRFDEVICFKPLTKDVLEIIINREIGKILERKGLISLGVPVEIDPLVKDYIIETGYDPKYGARHIKRAVEKAVATSLGKLIATTKIGQDDQIRVNLHAGEPIADLITRAQELLDSSAGIPDAIDRLLVIPEKNIKMSLEALRSRIESLKAMFDYISAMEEKTRLQQEMTRPAFWDKPDKAKLVLKKFAEINRKTERIHRWDRSFDRIMKAQELGRQLDHPAERSRTHRELISLMKDLESAEMEILLEGKYDFADAFIIIRTESGPDNVKWLLELTKVYTGWANRRGYTSRIIGEEHATEKNASIYLHIGGMNAFGLLKNERGIHRKEIFKKKGAKAGKLKLDCQVYILADVQSSNGGAYSGMDIQVKKIKKPIGGWRLKSLTRTVTMEDSRSGIEFNFYTDKAADKDSNLLGDLFLSYLHYDKRKLSASSDSGNKWGSLVRTYISGDGARLVDHRTKIVLKNVKDYLAGKIDSLLLERII